MKKKIYYFLLPPVYSNIGRWAHDFVEGRGALMVAGTDNLAILGRHPLRQVWIDQGLVCPEQLITPEKAQMLLEQGGHELVLYSLNPTAIPEWCIPYVKLPSVNLHKGVLYPAMWENGTPHLHVDSPDVQRPDGYYCPRRRDILPAARRIKSPQIVVGPANGADGKGISFPSKRLPYVAPTTWSREVNVMERVPLRVNPDRTPASLSFVYRDGQVVGATHQYTTPQGEWFGNDACLNPDSQARANVQAYLEALPGKGTTQIGGVDMVYDTQRKLWVILDPNVNRHTGAHVGVQVAQNFGKRYWSQRMFETKHPFEEWQRKLGGKFFKPGSTHAGLIVVRYDFAPVSGRGREARRQRSQNRAFVISIASTPEIATCLVDLAQQ